MLNVPSPPSFPDTASMSALRSWYAGVGSREALERYCPQALEGGQSARGVIGRIRRQLASFAISRHRADLARLFQCAMGERTRYRKAATRALDILPTLAVPQPQVSDPIGPWLPSRVVHVLHQHGIRTLADLTVRIPRRQRWWRTIPGLGMRSARHIEAFFAAHPALTESARALIVMTTPEFVVPWESIRVPHEVDGSRGAFRAPKPMCALEADNDYQAISAWLEWHEAAETQRAYRLCRSKARGLSKREMICITYETSE
ncbi:Mobile element protein [Caballeronia sordidicola]|uniref:Mobile element protein n=2 Tax=Caballeronia sordidicola TaxID=196367 RepID=A0A242MHV0_CABSO|nr:Mobile element protein [Caballeronia sordidicola]